MKKVIVIVLVVAAAFTIGGIGWAVCSPACGYLCLTNTYPLAVSQAGGGDEYYYNTIPIEIDGSRTVTIDFISGESVNIAECWFRLDTGTWIDITSGMTNFTTSGAHSLNFSTLATADTNDGSVVVSAHPSNEQARYFGWQTCDTTP